MRILLPAIIILTSLWNCVQLTVPPVDAYIATLVSMIRPKTASLEPALVPLSLAYSNSPYTFTLGLPIVPITPAVTGTITNCTSEPALPADLVLEPTTCAISGTPNLV